ncbi:SDR family oxidoreductase [Pusillimonas sp. ANT_WB101]|uniref:SDR family oxidoreductase n=1 Tax=Pusillimonas sp. ANT_WB101 TaxID=2597356 RepID=UPI0011EE73D5|nr:SDR family oxidoreductase [Pusillimonas sp. ANT_WB101]KAA0890657.1 SDR family oxidoreductase [Pusillimonas sp. ANT_WB101]
MAPANNTVLITGGSRGIGAATAVIAAREGFDVAVNYLTNAAAAHQIVQAVERRGRKAVAIQGNMGNPADIPRIIHQAEEALGPLSALVNNAGITGPIGQFSSTTDEMIAQVFQVNVLGLMHCCRLAIESFIQNNIDGVIVNVSSAAARTGSPGEYVHYAASKAAVETFTIGLAREIAVENIRVCAVSPGSTLTDIHATAGEPGRPQRVAPRIPMGRLAQPEEIGEAIVWLLTPQASYMTGTVLNCAGGI